MVGAMRRIRRMLQFGRTAATNQLLPGLLLQLPVAAGATQQALLEWACVHNRVYLGQGLWAMHTGGDDNGGLVFLHQPAQKLCSELDFDRTLNSSRALPMNLPFGSGHSYLNSGVGAVVLGGWKVSGIISVSSGLPFTVQTNGVESEYTGNCPDRPTDRRLQSDSCASARKSLTGLIQRRSRHRADAHAAPAV